MARTSETFRVVEWRSAVAAVGTRRLDDSAVAVAVRMRMRAATRAIHVYHVYPHRGTMRARGRRARVGTRAVAAAAPTLFCIDRDGVINVDVGAPGVIDVRDFVLLPRAAMAVKMLNDAGVRCCVVTNQTCVGKALATESYVRDVIHGEMRDALAREGRGARVDGVIYATRTREQAPACTRRKPAPGMVLEALETFDETDAARVVFVGDTVTDMQAAARAGGLRRALVCTGYGEVMGKALRKANVSLPTTLTCAADVPLGTMMIPDECFPVDVFEDLFHAVTCILNETP